MNTGLPLSGAPSSFDAAFPRPEDVVPDNTPMRVPARHAPTGGRIAPQPAHAIAKLFALATVLMLALPLAPATADTRTPPSSPARMVAEWEPALGTLIRWPLGFPMALAIELAEDDTLYTLVEGASNENQARNSFANAGVNMDHVRFIRTNTYSMWTRDWGPQCVFGADGQMGIADPWFDGYPWVPGCSANNSAPAGSPAASDATPSRAEAPRRNAGPDGIARTRARGYDDDDAVNADVAIALGLPLHELPAYCTGGNIMTDGHRRAFSTEQMLAENEPYMSHGSFYARAEDYLGITDYQILQNPEVHGIQHIDCYAKLLDEETVLIKQVPSWHPEYDCCEELAIAFSALTTCYGRPYHIVRIWCEPYYGDEVAAYTNSLILNGKVLVPTFGLPEDADALQVYQDAMPGYEVLGIYYSSWYYYDALHCRTMGIFDPGMLRVTHARLDDVVPAASDHEIVAIVEALSQAGLVAGAQRVRWRVAGDAQWNDAVLSAAGGDTLVGAIPGQMPGEVIEYYVTTSDQSGRTETLPRTAPEGFYSFRIDPSSSVLPEEGSAPPSLSLAARPSPFSSSATLSFTLPVAQTVTLTIHDAAGRVVTVLRDDRLPAGAHESVWDGTAASGGSTASGVYFARLRTTDSESTAKLVLLR